MTSPTKTDKTGNSLLIEFLYLDLETCTRCLGTDRALEQALDAAGEVLAAAGAAVEVERIHVTTAEVAQEHRFVSSPTIRVNGRDIALELRESSCGSEACTDGCGGSVACRVWVHDGVEHTEPPVAMIVDAILREVYGGFAPEQPREAVVHELPDNLKRFFGEPVATCCSPSEQRTCCDPADKAECCGAGTGDGCGCR
jgi:hypothetical protein